MLVLPQGPFDAFLFDLDGTVADTIPFHYRSWILALRPHGCPFPPDLFDSMNGLTFPRTVEVLNEMFGKSLPVDAIVKEKERFYLELLPGLRAVPEVLDVIESHRGKLPFAIVSGSPRFSIDATLSLLSLGDRFSAIVGQEDYARGKPHPEPFLVAAKKLGVAPETCLVFEDADAGIESARAAGMRFVRVERAPTVAIDL